jgi:putative transposase
VQQQAVRDHANAMEAFFKGTHGKPTWRKAGKHEGFRIVGVEPRHVRRLNRKTGEVNIPKVGWVRFRWSCAVPEGVKSFRVTRDRSGRWHVAFAHVPDPVPSPGNGEVVGVDRGVASCRGECQGPDYTEQANLAKLRPRSVGKKRSLALREYILGLEGLEGLEGLDRVARGEPLWRVHECVFGVLALESEPVDPRL